MADLAGYYPTSPWFNAVDFSVNTPTITSETNAGKVRRVGYGHSFYSWTVKYPNMTQAQLGPIAGFIAQTRGPLLSFEIVLPQISYTKSSNPSVSTVSTSQTISAGVSQVTVSGATASSTILLGGDFFKFASHSKVYQATNTCTADGSGNATLYFSGNLVADVTSGANITTTAVPFTAIMESDAHQVNVGMGGMSTLSLQMRETW
tara:strand:+ start:5898 stop:6512 length:615 start_codon:yes stop_codon:yes gene_type:complete